MVYKNFQTYPSAVVIGSASVPEGEDVDADPFLLNKHLYTLKSELST